MSLAEAFSQVNTIVGNEPLKILMDNGFPCMIYSTDILITLHPFPKATAPFIIQQQHTNTALCFKTSQLLNQVQNFCNMFKILWWLEKQ